MTQISFGSHKSKNSKGKVRISYQEVRISGFWHELYELQFVMLYPVIKCKCFLVFNTEEIPFLSMSRISRIQSCWMELLSCYSSRSYSSSCLEISIADVATTVLNVSQRPFSCLEILVHTTDSRVGIPANTRGEHRGEGQMHQKHRQERKLIFGTLDVSRGFQAETLARAIKTASLSWFWKIGQIGKWTSMLTAIAFYIFDSFIPRVFSI